MVEYHLHYGDMDEKAQFDRAPLTFGAFPDVWNDLVEMIRGANDDSIRVAEKKLQLLTIASYHMHVPNADRLKLAYGRRWMRDVDFKKDFAWLVTGLWDAQVLGAHWAHRLRVHAGYQARSRMDLARGFSHRRHRTDHHGVVH